MPDTPANIPVSAEIAKPVAAPAAVAAAGNQAATPTPAASGIAAIALTPGTPYTSTSPNITVTVPNTSGSVIFSLVVTDNLGTSSVPATCTVQIQAPPTAVLTASPSPAAAGSPIALSSVATTTGTIKSYTYSVAPAPTS